MAATITRHDTARLFPVGLPQGQHLPTAEPAEDTDTEIDADMLLKVSEDCTSRMQLVIALDGALIGSAVDD